MAEEKNSENSVAENLFTASGIRNEDIQTALIFANFAKLARAVGAKVRVPRYRCSVLAEYPEKRNTSFNFTQ